MEKIFGRSDWKNFIPFPICDELPEYSEFYEKAWELAYAHIKHIDGLPQTPYMDEALCDTQVWIWDSCFMSLFCKYAREAFPGVETLNNFYEVLHNGKRLAGVIPTENEPFWAKSTPGEAYELKVHIADNPPLFAWAEYENALMSGDMDYIKDLLYNRRFLQKHYEWIENLKEPVHPDGVCVPTCLISEKDGYKWEGGRSGMDNTPRGRTGEHALEKRPNNPDMLWLDAICQQAFSAKIISKLFSIAGDKDGEGEWFDRYLEKKEIINRLYLNKEDGFYYDIDCNTHDFYKILSIASYWPMTAGVVSDENAKFLASQLSNPDTFGGCVPFTSLSRSDADFNPEGLYWRGSVWLPTAYAALKGLAEYGLFEEAHKASLTLLEHMYRTYREYEPHTIWECYSPTEFKPATNDNNNYAKRDFCGWSALGPISVYIEFILGFHSADAFTRTVKWAKPDNFKGRIGIKNLRFGSIVTDIEANGECYTVKSNEPYTLTVNGKEYNILAGTNEFN